MCVCACACMCACADLKRLTPQLQPDINNSQTILNTLCKYQVYDPIPITSKQHVTVAHHIASLNTTSSYLPTPLSPGSTVRILFRVCQMKAIRFLQMVIWLRVPASLGLVLRVDAGCVALKFRLFSHEGRNEGERSWISSVLITGQQRATGYSSYTESNTITTGGIMTLLTSAWHAKWAYV